MVDYRFVEVSEKQSDLIVDAEFGTDIPPSKVERALREICDAVSTGMNLSIFLEGLSAVQITSERIELAFRFSDRTEAIAALDTVARDELPRKRANFVIHVFARLDQVHTLGDVPFPPNFRDFSSFGDSV